MSQTKILVKARTHQFIVAGGGDFDFNHIMKHQVMNKNIEPPMSHEACLEKIASESDRSAFIVLFEHFAPRLKSFLLKSGTTPQMAEEVVQETMLTIWRKAGSFNPAKAAASTWIFTIARNKRIDMLRKINRPQYDELDPALQPDRDVAPIEKITHDQNSKILKSAIEDLPEQQSFLIKKAFYEDKSHQAIAEELKIPLGTVKSRIRLGMERLRHSLKQKISPETMH